MVTNKELEKRLETLEARFDALGQKEELPELPAPPKIPSLSVNVCARCGHAKEDHVPLSSRACFVAGCRCKGFTTKEKRRIRFRFKKEARR